MEEIWKWIEGYEGFYEVSNMARVRSHDRRTRCDHCRHVDVRRGRVLTGWIDFHGYHRVGLNKDGSKYHKLVHRLVAQAFIPNPELKETVNHMDGNKLNNLPSNLEWATQPENMAHARATGLMPLPQKRP